MVNSMNLKNDQFFKNKGAINRNKTQDANVSQKILNTTTVDSMANKINREFFDQHKHLMSVFLKIQKECKEISPKQKEDKCKKYIKDIENLQIKISSIKKQLVV